MSSRGIFEFAVRQLTWRFVQSEPNRVCFLIFKG